MSGLRRRDKAGHGVAEKNADEICLLNFTHKVCFRMGNVCHEQVPGLMPLNIKFIWRSFSNLTVPRTPYRKRGPPLPPRDEQTRGRRKSIEILVVVQDEVVRKDSSIIIVLPSYLLQLGYHFNSSTYRGGIRIGGAKDLYLFCISSNHPPTHSPLAQIEYSLSICTRAKSLIDVCSCISPSLFSH